MLSKKICKKCINKKFIVKWRKNDEMNWTHFDKVFCAYSFEKDVDGFISIQDAPPPACPFLLEYTLENQKNER